MVTIYDLLEVKENASKEEIEKSYQSLITEYRMDPNLSDEENKENEMILNKLKIAYEIVMNDEKRKKYDNDLAKKRAEDLIQNVVTNNEVANSENEETSNKVEKNVPNANNKTQTVKDDSEYYDEENNYEYEETEEQDVDLTEKEKQEVRRAAEKDFKEKLKKAQKVEEEYNQAYNKAYNDYFKQLEYNKKTPLTFKKIKNTIIVLAVTILVCFIAWQIPPVRNLLQDLYKNNFIIRSLVNLVKIFVNSIIGIFK